MKILSWLSQKLSKLHLPFIVKKVTGEDYYLMRDELLPGDIILCTTKGWFLNWANPSEYKHGALYIGGNKIKYVLEATSKGVIKTNLVDCLLSRDRFIVKRKKDITDEERQLVVEKAVRLEGLEYDWSFTDEQR
jgi:hypothetical protein